MLNRDLKQEFVCGSMSITREDYESMPCAMFATEFNDKQMQEIVNKLHDVLTFQYGYTEHEISNLEDGSAEMEDYDNAFWREMENIAVDMGMRYYDDMTDDEYKKIIGK